MSKGRKKKILSNIYTCITYVLVSYEIDKFWDYDVEQKIILENEKSSVLINFLILYNRWYVCV